MAEECPICFEPSEKQSVAPREFLITCPRCGKFIIDSRAEHIARNGETNFPELETRYLLLGAKGSRERAGLSAWLRERNEKGIQNELGYSFFLVGEEDENRIDFQSSASQVTAFHDRANKLLLAIKRNTKSAGQQIDLGQEQNKYLALSWAADLKEFEELLKSLEKKELIEVVRPTKGFVAIPGPITEGLVSIATEGWGYLEKLEKPNLKKRIGF